jgi:hypothetical protein
LERLKVQATRLKAMDVPPALRYFPAHLKSSFRLQKPYFRKDHFSAAKRYAIKDGVVRV